MARDLVLDRAAIQALVPHRDPFLFVDRVIGREAGSITTEWDVAHDLSAFAGHYPGRPVLPGVLIAEFAFQSAAILLADDAARSDVARGAVPVLTRIEDARYKKIVRPGETLRAVLETDAVLANARFMKAHVTSGGATVARLRFTVALVEGSA